MMYELDKKTRENKILEVTQTSKPVMSGVKLPIRPDDEFFVWRIPLDYVIYNHLNDRFASKRREHEIETGIKLDLNSVEQLHLIERFIWESNISSNQETIKDLAKNGQLKFGIVTEDGRIIDGNRRASLIRKIYYSDPKDFPNAKMENFRYFHAVVLPGNISDDEMLVLETEIQMGEDDKVDYNPIEKYLKINKLIENGKSYNDIVRMIKSVKNAKMALEMHEIYNLMTRYLEFIGAPYHFSLISKYEDHFIKLNKTIEYFKSGTFSSNWRPTEADYVEFQQIAFNYIRKGHEGKDFRNLMGGKTDKKGIFSNHEVWKKFVNKHNDIIDDVDEKIKKVQFDSIAQKEEFWISESKKRLDTIYNRAKESMSNLSVEIRPKDLAEGALEKLKIIDIESAIYRFKNNISDESTMQELYRVIIDIHELTKEMKDRIITDVFKKGK